MSAEEAPPAGDLGDWRDRVMTDPDLILEDRDLMRALIAANERTMGKNIVDLRGLAMERLETRLDRLETTHRSVIAAAYENLAGTNQIHRAVLRLLERDGFTELLDALHDDVTQILRVDALRLALESAGGGQVPHDALAVVPPGFLDAYLTGGRDVPVRDVTLRQCDPAAAEIFGEAGAAMRSEAALRLDLGPRRGRAALLMACEDPHHFAPNQGVDLLTFFGGVLERLLRRHLRG